MASIVFNHADAPLLQGTTFIFGSWISVADSAGGFSNYLAEDVITHAIGNPSPDQGSIAESESVSGPPETQLPAVELGLRGLTVASSEDELAIQLSALAITDPTPD
jgi:hypothetical protein